MILVLHNFFRRGWARHGTAQQGAAGQGKAGILTMLPIFDHLREENRSLRDTNAELRRCLAVMWHAFDTDNRPPHDVLQLAKRCYDEGRRTMEGQP